MIVVTKRLVREFAHKLASLHHLVIHPFNDNGGNNLPVWDLLKVREFSTLQVTQLRVARMLSLLLLGLRHVLSEPTDLAFGLPGDALGMSLNTVAEFLRAHSSTLIKLNISDEARDPRWSSWSRYGCE